MKFLNDLMGRQKKIVVFFLNHLIDVNFHSGPRTIFKDNYTWTNFLLNKIKSIKNVNWILKVIQVSHFTNQN